jgi:hypothetical protein
MIAFGTILTILSATWIAAIVLQARIYAAETAPVYDWFTPGFNGHYVSCVGEQGCIVQQC